MMPLQRETKDHRVVIKCGASFVDRLNRAANEHFDGDRSDLIRTAVVNFLEHKDRELVERETLEAVAS